MMNDSRIDKLKMIANQVRINIIKEIYYGGSGHPGGSLSCTDILTALYFEIMNIDPKRPKMPTRDKFILSKAHAAPAVYAVLAEKGYIEREQLKTFSHNGSHLQKHIDMREVPGIDISGGSLGQGLSVGVGMALAAKADMLPTKVYICLGDGELDEGQNWEAAMSASHYKLDNLTVIIDRNNLQVDGSTDEIMNLEPLDEKWKAFGFSTSVIDGHNMKTIVDTLNAPAETGCPKAIIAKTIKGKGISFMENQYKWHAGSLTIKQAEQAMMELGGVL